ncbi:MAG: riboflavin biosynthesis protein RibF [Actinobacteria bacterium]|nr:riboflavin biosynthesis protein RibF [Actinomycetota bacterium]
MSKSVVVLGVLDGVHLGHQLLLTTAADLAAELDAKVVVVSFDPHPSTVIQKSEVELICSVTERKELLIQYGADRVEVLDFDQSRMQQTPQEFISEVLIANWQTVAVVVGEGYRFGYKAQGTALDIAAAGIRNIVVAHKEFAGGRISSSRIRQAIKNGEVSEAALMLGRPFTLTGPVVVGDQRGRLLGYPTANLQVDVNQVLPKAGVYAGYALAKSQMFQAAISVGANLTFGGEEMRIEAHLIGTSLDLYGEKITISFVEYLRSMHHFDSQKELIEQMDQDVVRVGKLLTGSL